MRNATRSSLLVRVPGHSIHLLPGNAAEVHRVYLNTEELAALVRRGAVVLEAPGGTVEARVAEPKPTPEASDDDATIRLSNKP